MNSTQTAMSNDINEWAIKAGATHARPVDNKLFIVRDSVLASCAANACGKYGRCWTCPPNNGTPEELKSTLAKYSSGILVQNITALEDSWDFEGMTAAMKIHNDMMREVAAKIRSEYPDADVLTLGCGGCGYCEKCSCPDSPCLFPEQAISSVEGYGMDARLLVQSCGLSYINGADTVSYVGLFLIR
ncbi:MAG: DUF2284 domain-containing protein [Armatimonadota bacterium]